MFRWPPPQSVCQVEERWMGERVTTIERVRDHDGGQESSEPCHAGPAWRFLPPPGDLVALQPFILKQLEEMSFERPLCQASTTGSH
jgi:hypothetical protein